jgi:hypothetical protein
METEEKNNFLKQEESFIAALSEKLVVNHLANSFNRGANVQEEIDYPFVLNKGGNYNEYFGKDKKIRNVLIIGAGAIYNSFGSIPLGDGIIKALQEKYFSWFHEQNINPFQKRIKDDYENLILLNKQKKLSLEDFLCFLSKHLLQEDLHEEIKDLVGFMSCTNLFYEIIAHLFKHSFIDVIINFNFEEGLDEAIKEELGEGNYHNIISDGHTLKSKNLFTDGRIKFPVYIKPHGTVGHLASLKYTNEQYLDTPIEIKNMLSEILSPCENDDQNFDLNIICVGFQLFESVEFKNILKNTVSKNSHTNFFIITNSAQQKEQLEKISKNLGVDEEIYKDKVFAYGLKFNDSKNEIIPSLGELFSKIFRKVEFEFKQDFKPRSIAKHEILSYFLYNKKLFSNSDKNRNEIKDIFHSSSYYVDKILIEIAFSFVRNHGNLNILDLLSGRVGSYLFNYEKYFEIEKLSGYLSNPKKEIEKETIYSLISEFSKNGKNARLLAHEWEYEYSKNFFKLPLLERKVEQNDDVINDIRSNFNDLGLTTDDFINQIIHYEINENLLGYTSLLFLLRSDKLSKYSRKNILMNHNEIIINGKENIENGSNNLINELFRLFTKSTNKNFFHIQNQIKNNQYFYWESFSRQKLLQTNLSIGYLFKKRFLENDWNTLLAVLETGIVLRESFQRKYDSYNSQEKGKFSTWFSTRKIILLLSFEAAHQVLYFHDEEYKKIYDEKTYRVDEYNKKSQKWEKVNDSNNSYLIAILEERYKRYLLKGIINDAEESLLNNLGIVFLPYWEHNHHASIFLKLNEVNVQSDKYMYLQKVNEHKKVHMEIFSGFHVYRKGNSNSINPIHIDFNYISQKIEKIEVDIKERNLIIRDFEKILLLFYLNLCRGVMYQVQVAPHLEYRKQLRIDELTTYKAWDSEKFYNQMIVFLENLREFECNYEDKKFYDNQEI